MSFLEFILPPEILCLRILKNKLEVKHIQSGREIKKSAVIPFSNDRLLIADFNNAEALFREVNNEMFSSKSFRKSLHVVVQPVDEMIKNISSVENRAYIDFAEFAGASKVRIYPTQEKLSDQEVLDFLKRKL